MRNQFIVTLNIQSPVETSAYFDKVEHALALGERLNELYPDAAIQVWNRETEQTEKQYNYID